MKKNLLALSISAVLVSGCVFNDEAVDNTPSRQRSATLAELNLQPSANIKAELPKLTLAELSASYKGLLNTVSDPNTKIQIQQRIAVLEVMQGEQAQIAGSPEGDGYYAAAITSLTSFIEQNPNGEENDKLMYQLAKAYDLQGDQDKSLETLDILINDYPENEFMLEIHFRRAEILFSRQAYFPALSSYKVVTESNVNNPYFTIALYMQGWSYFKLEQTTLALNSFSAILDEIMPYKVMATVNNLEEFVAELEPKDKQMAEETFSVMTLIFSSAEGATAITEHYEQLGERPYEYLNYDLLGQFYADKQRYSDAVDVFNEFIRIYPNHQVAALFSIKKMDVYKMGRFPSELSEEKRRFVADYQFSAPYWEDKNEKTRAAVSPVLMDILIELSQNSHANAQEQNRLLASGEASDDNQQQVVIDAYTETAYWYETFIANFPEHPAVNTIKFYLAESYYEVGDYQKAARFYEYVAYNSEPIANVNESVDEGLDGSDENGSAESAESDEAEYQGIEIKDNRAEAAYALILTYDKIVEQESDQVLQNQLQAKRRGYKTMFIDNFNDDPRVKNVQTDVFQEFFKAGEHENAITYAQLTLADHDDLTIEQTLSALLVIGHSQFAQEDYPAAEQTYDRLLATMPLSDERYDDMTDRLAASIYRQGELAANAEPAELEQAVVHFARVLQKAPNSKVRKNAQYDMATHLLTLERHPEAINQLLDFQERYPEDPLLDGIPTKLAFAYQETEQWAESAMYLRLTWEANPQSEETRKVLWLAAETYEKAGNEEQALNTYRNYANTYPLPFDTSIEAKNKMTEFYQVDKANGTGDEMKYKFWLNKLISADANAGANRTPRSRYLAAKSSMYFADEAMAKFTRKKLTLPLKKSLGRKRVLLDQTLTAYNKTVSYQVKEFTTVSNFKIGEIYSQLAKDLMASQRPKDLNELELEQYEILLEEQSFPFEDKAIVVHEANVQRSWDGVYDQWVQKSFDSLSRLLPGRYNKPEEIVEVVNEIY